MEKKRGADYRTRELWRVWWFHPLRYSGMNYERAFTLPFCTPPVVACDNNSVLTTPFKPRLARAHATRSTHIFFFRDVSIRNSIRSNKYVKNIFDYGIAEKNLNPKPFSQLTKSSMLEPGLWPRTALSRWVNRRTKDLEWSGIPRCAEMPIVAGPSHGKCAA